MMSHRFLLAAAAAVALALPSPARPAGSSPPPPPPGGATPQQQAEQSQFDKGMDLVKSEQWADARKIFEQLEAQQPKNPEVLNMLAYTQRKTGDIDNALTNYKRALAIKPKFPEAREYLAEAYLQAALREAETLRGYGGAGEEQLEKLTNAFQEASSHVEGKGGNGKKDAKKSNW
jgi:predicted Zn-dependent protease